MKNSGIGIADAVSAKQFAGKSGVAEWHVVVHGESSGRDSVAVFERQWLEALHEVGISPETTILRRVFCSDIVNQYPEIETFATAYPGAFSAIGQAPANGPKMAMWSYHIVDPGKIPNNPGGGPSFILQRGSLRHSWSCGLSDVVGSDARAQSITVMETLDHWLIENGLTLNHDVIRTWFFVRDIDADYQALVETRKAVFEKHGLTQDTHYIASTGIAGAHHVPTVKLSLDAYAVGGLIPGQVEHLIAPDHLGPTHRYGVTFERATAVSYSDRKHVFISGTASIDPSGEIVHPGDVVRQLDRALDNVSALLASAGATSPDLSMIIVYLRDPADGAWIDNILRQRFPELPMMLVYAPVCRPGWLIEVEGIAYVPAHNPNFPEF